MSSLSAARIGIGGWFGLLAFGCLFLVALKILDDPGEDWPPYVWIAPLVCGFAARLPLIAGTREWENWLAAYLLCATAAWITTGPWTSFHTWRRPVLALVTPILLLGAMATGHLAEIWAPRILMK